MTRTTSAFAFAAALALACAGLVGCEARLVLGGSCAQTSECASPLVCRFERCRTECVTTRDCPIGTVCLAEEGGGVCRLPAESACSSDADCPGALACALGACRNRCVTVDDCRPGAECVADVLAGTVCVDPGDAPDAGARPDGGGTTDAGIAIDGPADDASLAWTLVVSRDAADGEISASGSLLLPGGEEGTDFFGAWGTGQTRAFFGFELPAAIPAGARIADARLRLFGIEFASFGCAPTDEMVIVGANVANASTPGSATAYPDGPTGPAATLAATTWRPIDSWTVDAWNESPDVSAILDELVSDHAGLAAGATIQLWIVGANFTDRPCEWGAEDFARATSNHAELVVTFEP